MSDASNTTPRSNANSFSMADLAYCLGTSVSVARKLLWQNNPRLSLFQNPNEPIAPGELLTLAGQLPPDVLTRIILLLLLKCGAGGGES